MMPLSCWFRAEKKYCVFSLPPLMPTSVSYDRLLSPYSCRSKSWNPPLLWNIWSTAAVSALHSGGGDPEQNVGAAQAMASARLNRRSPSVFDKACVPRRWVTENRAGPGAPCRVVMMITPFAADEP